jgi:hypothetical protein
LPRNVIKPFMFEALQILASRTSGSTIHLLSHYLKPHINRFRYLPAYRGYG